MQVQDEEARSVWDTDSNPAFNQRYNNLASNLTGGVVASLADFGTTVWNSLPLTPEVSTYDLLERLDGNALRVYEENPDTIRTASFIGGIFVPAGLALKSMNAARSGMKGVGWFNDAGKQGMLTKLDALYRQGPDATKSFRAMQRQYYARGVANNVLDAVAMEVAIVGAINAHPFMEDYMKDPVKHFAIGLGIGGVVGGGIGHIADRFAIKGVMGRAEQSAWATTLENYKPVFQGLPQVSKLQMRAANIETLEHISGLKVYDPIVKSVADSVLLAEKAAQKVEFDSLAGKMISGIDSTEDQLAILNRLADDVRFQGADTVDLLRIKTTTKGGAFKAKGDGLQYDFTPANFVDEKGRNVAMIYLPEFQAFVTPAEALQYARASVLGETGPHLARNLDDFKAAIRTPDNDASLNIFSKRSPEVDAQYLQRLILVDKLDKAAFARMVVSPDDLFTINALVAKAMKDPDAMAGIKIRVTKNQPSYGAMQQQAIKESGVSADHFEKLMEFTNPAALRQFDMLGANSSLSPAASALLDGWKNGNRVAEMRTAADAFYRGGFGGRSPARALVEEMHNSPQSVALRAKFAEQADAEGNIYLWRGLKQNPRGHAALESYTTDINKAKEFGTPKLFKVHVDDILGAIADLKSKDGLLKAEIIVGAPARQIETRVVSKSGAKGVPKLSPGIEELELKDLSERLARLKEENIEVMAKQGLPAEVIAIRTNTPVGTVRAYLADYGGKSLEDLSGEGFPYMTYNNAGKVDEYLSPLQQPMIIRANKNKVPYAELSAAQDVRALDVADRDIKATFLLNSQSQTAKEVGKLFFSEERRPLLDILRQQLSSAVKGVAGFKFLQSADFYARDMAEFGKIASLIGKDVMHLGNEATKRILTPVTSAMNIVAKKPETLLEFNTAAAVNASIRGKRYYQDGAFMVPVEKIGPDGKKVMELEPATYQGKEFKVVSPEVDTLLRELASAGKEMYHLKNAGNKILGKRDVTDLGFWMPAFNPAGKHITYVWNKLDNTTSVLWGNSAEELADAVGTYRSVNAAKISRGDIEVVSKGEQELWNISNGRADPFRMEIANVEQLHTGASTPAIVKANVDIFTDITQSYEHYIQANVRSLADMSMSDITGNLMRMSQVNQLPAKNQPLTKIQEWIGKKEDPAQIMRNTLLGVNNVSQAPAWQAANQWFETVAGVSFQKIGEAWKGALSVLPKKTRQAAMVGEDVNLKGIDYETLNRKLEEAGIFNPYAVFEEKAAQMFGVAKLTDSKNITPRMVYAGNALAATVVLRFGEVAQPLVNAISLPILAMGAIAERLPATFMGVQKGTAKVPPLKAMMEGVQAMNSQNPQFVRWGKQWEKAGYFKPLVSEASDVLKLSRSFEEGIIAKTEQAIDSQLVTVMSKGADYSEALVRKTAMFIGGNLAKRLYPELDDVGVTIFARDFMDKVVGNYHAAQRPTLFQGTMGAAMSLFQTYMLTMAQRVYRQLETKDYKALGKMMLTQSTLFGIGSLPGFRPISELIGEHYSDDNVDLVTGTFRALPDGVGNAVMYGLPSSVGPAFYSRGELAPRGPTTIGEFPAFNLMGQTVQAVGTVGKALGSDFEDVPRALMQALSMQSISRPLARLSEVGIPGVIGGYSVTRQGNTIAVPEEVWTPMGVFARVLTTRPLEEAKLRDLIHIDRVYGSLDRRERQKATAELKTAIRNRSLTDEKLHRIAEVYLRTGSPQGWRSTVTTAISETDTSGREVFLNKLRPDSPFMHMLDQMDGAY